MRAMRSPVGLRQGAEGDSPGQSGATAWDGNNKKSALLRGGRTQDRGNRFIDVLQHCSGL